VDTQGHGEAANQVQEDTGGPAGILKDASPRRFGTVRPRVQIQDASEPPSNPGRFMQTKGSLFELASDPIAVEAPGRDRKARNSKQLIASVSQ